MDSSPSEDVQAYSVAESTAKVFELLRPWHELENASSEFVNRIVFEGNHFVEAINTSINIAKSGRSTSATIESLTKDTSRQLNDRLAEILGCTKQWHDEVETVVNMLRDLTRDITLASEEERSSLDGNGGLGIQSQEESRESVSRNSVQDLETIAACINSSVTWWNWMKMEMMSQLTRTEMIATQYNSLREQSILTKWNQLTIKNTEYVEQISPLHRKFHDLFRGIEGDQDDKSTEQNKPQNQDQDAKEPEAEKEPEKPEDETKQEPNPVEEPEDSKKPVKDEEPTIETDALTRLPHIDNLSHLDGQRSRCLAETRVAGLDRITTWLDKHDDDQSFWILGDPGTGKTTVAQTAADLALAKGYIVGSIFAEKDYGQDPHDHFSTIAHFLSKSDPTIEKEVRSAAKRVYELDTNFNISPEDLLEMLILAPLSDLHGLKSVLLIIDGTQNHTSLLPVMNARHVPGLKWLATISTPTPSHEGSEVKFVPELTGLRWNFSEDHDICTDVYKYVENRLWMDHPQWVEPLSNIAGQHFSFATTACDFLCRAPKPDEKDEKRTLAKYLEDRLAEAGISLPPPTPEHLRRKPVRIPAPVKGGKQTRRPENEKTPADTPQKPLGQVSYTIFQQINGTKTEYNLRERKKPMISQPKMAGHVVLAVS
ncbi:hypothetical protein BDQ12DRAFT_729449 [Crucibulum laeve]|uniref:Nephrocystin 3-like N-terminal domain-containing protein n=1 Tax=Crucibulum laeve TaxID=68775 RepID=A0A5C3LFB0_9AGAR|nr:hypothetical protein BDQ12DRAFT_729449 [Crucibulum laeve]